jgi:ATP-dependent Clp protease adaptor protein ClpS
MNDTTQVLPLEEQKTNSERLPQAEPLYNVVLLDDDEHTYEYVVDMLCRLFGHGIEQAYAMACEVDREGRVIVDTTHLERAELKRDQIRSYGADRLLHGSNRSMHATIEPMTG